MSAGTILLLLASAMLAWGVLIYNRLITQRNRYRNAFSQIDVQLTRRHELIPNLVEVAKQYMKHESETLTAVVEARQQASEKREAASGAPEMPGVLDALAGAEASLGRALGRLNVVMEDYPDLKADERMADLHRELSSTENRVAYARQAYSDACMRFNIERESFPSVLVALLFNFKQAPLFEIENEALREPSRVSFA